MYDWAVKNPTIVNPQESRKANIYIKGDKIARVSEELYDGKNEVDAEGLLAFPGLIDIHVHMRDLNQSNKEDFETGTKAALAGGYTIVADMPNSDPPTNSKENIRRKLEAAEERALIDYLLWAGVPDELSDLKELLEGHVCGVKVYMTDPNALNYLPAILRYSSQHDVLVCIHSEDPNLFEPGEANSLEEHGRKRTLNSELSAIDRTLAILPLGSRVHFTHLTSKESLVKVEALSKRGFEASCDSTPHHLLLSDDVEIEPEGIGKVNPPLRPRKVVRELQRAFKAMMVRMISSDHAPHTKVEKEQTFSDVPPGIAGIETAFPLTFDLVRHNSLPLNYLARIFSTIPASVLGIDGSAGMVAEGLWANLTLVDSDKTWRIRGRELRSKAGITPFEGCEAPISVEKVFLRGVLAYSEGEFLVDPGFGRLTF